MVETFIGPINNYHNIVGVEERSAHSHIIIRRKIAQLLSNKIHEQRLKETISSCSKENQPTMTSATQSHQVKTTTVDGQGMWRAWKRGFTSNVLAFKDLIDNAVDHITVISAPGFAFLAVRSRAVLEAPKPFIKWQRAFAIVAIKMAVVQVVEIGAEIDLLSQFPLKTRMTRRRSQRRVL